jgi:hypothetical protein
MDTESQDSVSPEEHCSYIRYVRHADVQAYLDKGWVISNELDGTHHGYYSKIMTWTGVGDPP